MTREEAIFTIEHRNGIMNYGETGQLAAALDMAIAALKADPCEDAVSMVAMWKVVHECETHNSPTWVWREMLAQLPPVTPKPTECEVAVSRADTLQSFESYCEKNCQYSKKQRDVMCGACMMGDAIEIVESLPPVTPKQRTSVWVGIDQEPHETWECGLCGFVIDGSGCIDPDEYRDIYKYCPNCGAKMGGVSE